jgi:hypothetical protein
MSRKEEQEESSVWLSCGFLPGLWCVRMIRLEVMSNLGSMRKRISVLDE